MNDTLTLPKTKATTALADALNKAAGHVAEPEKNPVVAAVAAANAAPPTVPPQAPTVAASETPKPINPLTVPRMRPNQSSMGDSGNVFRATAPRGTPPDHALHDEFWSSNADRLLVGDIVQIVPDDGTYFLEVYVHDADSPGRGIPNKRISVSQIRFVDMMTARRIPKADEYKVEFRGDFLKWCAVHIPSDKPVIEKGYDRGEAEEKLRAFLRVRGETKKPT